MRARRAVRPRPSTSVMDQPPMAAATGSFLIEGFDCPAPGALVLASTIALTGESCSTSVASVDPLPTAMNARQLVDWARDSHLDDLQCGMGAIWS